MFWIEWIFCCGLSSWVCSIDYQQDMLAQMLISRWKEVEGFQVPSWNDEAKPRIRHEMNEKECHNHIPKWNELWKCVEGSQNFQTFKKQFGEPNIFTCWKDFNSNYNMTRSHFQNNLKGLKL